MPTNKRDIRIIFVCTGNVCRSPMAEGLFKEYLKVNNSENSYTVKSAGIFAQNGAEPSKNSQSVMKKNSINISNIKSSLLDENLIVWSTHIFCMTLQHIKLINRIYPKYEKKVYHISEFSVEETLRNKDIPDPIGLGMDIYEKTKNSINEVIPSIFNFIENTS